MSSAMIAIGTRTPARRSDRRGGVLSRSAPTGRYGDPAPFRSRTAGAEWAIASSSTHAIATRPEPCGRSPGSVVRRRRGRRLGERGAHAHGRGADLRDGGGRRPGRVARRTPSRRSGVVPGHPPKIPRPAAGYTHFVNTGVRCAGLRGSEHASTVEPDLGHASAGRRSTVSTSTSTSTPTRHAPRGTIGGASSTSSSPASSASHPV